MSYNPQIGDLVFYSSKYGNVLGIINEIKQFKEYDPDAVEDTLYRVLWLKPGNIESGYNLKRITKYRNDYLQWRKDNGL